MNRRGFTIIELITVITVMGILLVLSVVNLRGSQLNANDAERKTDIESISLHLETFYKSGTDGSTTIGRYPSTVLTTDGATMTQMLRDIDIKSLIAPGTDDGDEDKDEHAFSTFKAADCLGTTCVQTAAGVNPQPTKDQYIYQPIKSDGTLCTLETDECYKFNLFYRLETDDTVYMVTSKNQ